MRIAKQILEERAKLIADARKLNDSIPAGTAPTAEQRAQLDKMLADADLLKDEADRAARFEAVDAEERAKPGREDVLPGGGGGGEIGADEARGLVIDAWLRRHRRKKLPLTERHVEACRSSGLSPDDEELSISLLPTTQFGAMQRAKSEGTQAMREHRRDRAAERRAMSSQSIADGGALLPPESMVMSLEEAQLAHGGVLNVAEIIRTAGRERMRWPTANDTGNTGRQIGEAKATTTATNPVLAAKFWDAYKFTSDLILVPFELLQESVFDLPSTLGRMLGERLGRIQATKFATGTGAATPFGIVPATPAATLSTGVATTATATAITLDEIKDLIASIDPAYLGGAGFLMHRNVKNYLSKIKGADGRYVWEPSIVPGTPDRLFTYAVNLCEEMASSIAADAKTVLFGQLSAYKVRQVGAVRLYRLTEAYRENDEDGFLAFIEADGNLLDAGTHPLKALVQHA